MTHHNRMIVDQLRDQLRHLQALLTAERKARVAVELELAEVRQVLREERLDALRAARAHPATLT
ncbi:MAG: hypothetical protein V3U34_00520 [candidate division NC10 bacterium]